MARIAGVDIPDKKRGEIALTYIYGIGRSTAQKILSKAEIDWVKKPKNGQTMSKTVSVPLLAIRSKWKASFVRKYK